MHSEGKKLRSTFYSLEIKGTHHSSSLTPTASCEFNGHVGATCSLELLGKGWDSEMEGGVEYLTIQ